VDCTCSTVTVFMPDKVIAAAAPGKDDVRRTLSAGKRAQASTMCIFS
jgi:hypothetical protein